VAVTHPAFDDDVHTQVDCVVTVIVPVLPVGDAVITVGVNVNVHAAPGSVIVNVRPAIVSVAVRAIVPVLAAAVYATVPDPVPLAPLVMVAHVAALAAVQLQPAVVVTSTVPLPPAAGSD